MSEEKLIAKGLDEERVLISSIRDETKKLLSITDDRELMKELAERYYNYSCLRITNNAQGEVVGYAILSGGVRIEIPRMFYGESQVVGKFEYIDLWFQQQIPKDPPIHVENLSTATYVDVNISIPNQGMKPQQMLWSPPMYPSSWTYWLNNPPFTRQHLLLMPIVGSGIRIEELREGIERY